MGLLGLLVVAAFVVAIFLVGRWGWNNTFGNDKPEVVATTPTPAADSLAKFRQDILAEVDRRLATATEAQRVNLLQTKENIQRATDQQLLEMRGMLASLGFTVPGMTPPTLPPGGPGFNPSAPPVQTGNFPPVLHHASDCPPQTAAIGGCSLDVGVHDDQIGLAFGVVVDWPKGAKADGSGRCELVILTPGWYEDLHLMDGRFEVYTIGSDRTGWIKNLGEQRAKEQQGSYNCPAKTFTEIPQWTSDKKSPPPGVGFQGPTSTGTMQQAVTQSPPASSSGGTQVQPPASAPQQSAPQAAPAQTGCDTVNCKERRGAGTFSAGEAVYGYTVRIDGGPTYTQCWMENVPGSGTVTDGVVNPWKTEVASARRCN